MSGDYTKTQYGARCRTASNLECVCNLIFFEILSLLVRITNIQLVYKYVFYFFIFIFTIV